MYDFGVDDTGRQLTAAPDADGVDLVIDEIRELARTELPRLRDEVDSGLQGSCMAFASAPRDVDLFGLSDEGLTLGLRAGAAHDVYVQTVDALIGALEEYAARLDASLQRAVDADADAETYLKGVLRALSEGSMIEAAHRRASAEYAALLTPDAADVDPVASSAPASGLDDTGPTSPAAPAEPSEVSTAGGGPSQGRQSFESGS